MSFPAVRTEKLTKRYGRLVALDGLDLVVEPGTVFGFLGPNGAGKSTTIRLLLGLALLVRMIGDGVAALGWLRWLSPFGLLALTAPYDNDRALPLLVLAVATVALLAAVPVAAARRDLRGGWLSTGSVRRSRLVLLGSPAGFAARRLLRPLAGWTAGVGAYFLLVGLLAASMTRFLADNPRFAELATQAGFAGLGTVEGYAAALFTVLPVPVGMFAAVRIAASAADEAARRLTLLYAQPVTRVRLLAAEAGVTAAGASVVVVVAGLSLAVGAQAVGAGLGPARALAGALNIMPVVLLCLGAAVLALGWLPRATALIGALPAAGGFLLQVIADSVDAPRWVGQLSPFAHLAPVPETSPAWPAIAGMLAVAAALAALGAVGYRSRDLLAA